MGRPKGSKNRPKKVILAEKKMFSKKGKKRGSRTREPSKAPTLVVTKDDVFKSEPLPAILPTKRYKRGTCVKTAFNCVVGSIVHTGTVVYQAPDSNFVRVLWEDKSEQCHHIDSIVECD
jgi:hypothetical protein